MLVARKFTHYSTVAFTIFVCSLTVVLLFVVPPFIQTSVASPRPSADNPVSVSLPNMSAVVGSNFTIPVTVGDTTGEGIRSFQFNLLYDPAIITPLASPIETAGTISAGMTVTTGVTAPGLLRVVFYSATHRTGAGILFRFLFTAVGDPGQSTTLIWEQFMFNEGVPGAVMTNGSVTITSGLEGDVADRFTGDGYILSNDVILARRFAVGNLSPNPAFNEYQRADISPYETLGDGRIDSSDVIMARRYASGTVPKTPVGGPTGPVTPSSLYLYDQAVSDRPETRLRFVGSHASRGPTSAAAIEWEPTGNEAAVLFTIRFDPAVYSNVRVALTKQVLNKATLTVNDAGAASGILRVLIDADIPLSFSKTRQKVVDISFDLAASAHASDAAFFFDEISISDAYGNLISGY